MKQQNAISPDLYRDVEREVMPIIRGAAGAFAARLGIGLDDAIQEGRIALLEALQKYDYNLSKGGIFNYARRAVRQSMYGLLYTATTQSRQPHIVIEDNGVQKTVRSWPIAMGDFELTMCDKTPDPERAAMDRELIEGLGELKMRLVNRLNDFQKKVFACLSNQDQSFTLYLRNIDLTTDSAHAAEEKNALIAAYLGTGKNHVDWAVHQIKRHFTELAEKQFSDIVQNAVQEGKWPMFHVSHRGNDVSFIQKTLSEQGLDPRPLGAPEMKRCEADGVVCSRSIETYDWGAIIHLRFGTKTATVIAEGRFNAVSGEVLTGTGLWKNIKSELPWYAAAQRVLSRA
jgi:hypothetical protein